MSTTQAGPLPIGSTRTLIDEILFEFARNRGPRGYNAAEYNAVQDFALRSAATTLVLALIGDRVKIDVASPEPYQPSAPWAASQPHRAVIQISEANFNELTSDPEIAPLAGVLREYLRITSSD